MARIEAHLDEEGGVGMTAEGQIKSFFQRWETLEAEKQQVSDLMKDLFAEAKGFGYDTKALRAAFRLKAKQDLDSLADAEFEAIVDTYMSALNAPTVQARDARMRAREKIEEFDPITGEFVEQAVNAKLVATVATGMQTETGRKALIAAVDIMIAREEAEEQNAPRPSENDKPCSKAVPQDKPSPAGIGSELLAGREGRHEGEAASADLPPNSEIDPNEDRAEGHSLDGNADANAGGDHVTAQEVRAATAGALVKPAPATKPLRPHCRNPGEHCGGYGSNHCHSCLRAAKEVEVAA